MRPWVRLIVAVVAVAGRSALAQDFELEITEEGLNRLVAQLGEPSSGGIHQPNALATLGYRNCHLVGSLNCPGASGQELPLAICEGPDGQAALVPGGGPVSWQWWITQARFTVQAQQLQFAASVRYRVGAQWFREERTVPAALSFDVAGQRLRMEVAAFKVPVTYGFHGVVEAITEVDVGRHLSFAIPIKTQTFQVHGLEGNPKTITVRAQGATIQYLAGKIRVNVDAAFD
jgi:hypothetical protein